MPQLRSDGSIKAFLVKKPQKALRGCLMDKESEPLVLFVFFFFFHSFLLVGG